MYYALNGIHYENWDGPDWVCSFNIGEQFSFSNNNSMFSRLSFEKKFNLFQKTGSHFHVFEKQCGLEYSIVLCIFRYKYSLLKIHPGIVLGSFISYVHTCSRRIPSLLSSIFIMSPIDDIFRPPQIFIYTKLFSIVCIPGCGYFHEGVK